MKAYAAAATDIGNHRKNNEDSHFIDESMGLYIVCDGMGGHAAGEVASERAIKFAVQFLTKHRESIEEAANAPAGAFRIINLVEEAIRFANLRLHELTDEFSDLRGAGTTLTLLQLVGEKAIMGHVGDSRLYLKRGAAVHLLSTDHTMAHEMMMDGTLTPEEAATSKYQHILTRNIGSETSVRVETLMFDILPDDVLILCSDGLSNYFDSETDFDTLLSAGELNSIADGLVNFANSAGGKDNITAIVIRGEHDDDTSQRVAKSSKQLAALKDTFLCDNLSESRSVRLLNISHLQSVPAGQFLAEEGESGPGFCLILEGAVRLTSPNGRVVTFGKGEYFGHGSLIGGGLALRTAKVIEDAKVLTIPRDKLRKLCRRYARLGRVVYHNIANELCAELAEATGHSESVLDDTGEWERDSITHSIA